MQQSPRYNTQQPPLPFGIPIMATPLPISPSHPNPSHSFSPFQNSEPVIPGISYYPSDYSLPEPSLLFGEARNRPIEEFMTGDLFSTHSMANDNLSNHPGFYSSNNIRQPSPLMELIEISTNFSRDSTATSTVPSLSQIHPREAPNHLERTGYKHLSPYNAMTLEVNSFHEFHLPEDPTQSIFSTPTSSSFSTPEAGYLRQQSEYISFSQKN